MPKMNDCRSIRMRWQRVEKPAELRDALKRSLALDKRVVVGVVTGMHAIAPHPWAPSGRDFHSYQRTGT